MKTFLRLPGTLFACTTFVFLVLTASTAFNQVDTLKADSLLAKPVVELEKISELKDIERDLVKDSIAQNLQSMGTLKPLAQQARTNFKVAENNLREVILKSDGDVQPIDKVYRIDTSPRPVIINFVYPAPKEASKKGWLFRRD